MPLLGNLVQCVAAMESNFAGVPGPGFYRVQFTTPFSQTPYIVATVRDVATHGGNLAPQPWTVYLKDAVLQHFDIVVQRGGLPLPTGSPISAIHPPDQNQPVYVYWLAVGIR